MGISKGGAAAVDGQMAASRVDTSRLAELYDRHAGEATRIAFLMTGDRHLAEDLAQEAFVRLAGRFLDLRNPDAFGAYLRRTVINLSHGHFRRRKVERTYLEKHGQSDQTPGRIPDVEGRDELWRALSTLSSRQRAAIILRYYEDLSEAQTADALGCSVGAVKSLVNRGMEKLRTVVQRTGEVVT